MNQDNARQILPNIKDLDIGFNDLEEIEDAAFEWIEYLKSQQGIDPSDDRFDFDNQLDDLGDGGDYTNVINFIRLFFDIPRRCHIAGSIICRQLKCDHCDVYLGLTPM